LHLAEVSLARQSGKVPEKNEQDPFMKAFSERKRVATKIHKGQLVNRDFFHQRIEFTPLVRLPVRESAANAGTPASAIA